MQTSTANLWVFASHSQFVVFDPVVEQPWNEATSQHCEQGFAWRPGAVTFYILSGIGWTLDLEVRVLQSSEQASDLYRLNEHTVRAVEVPYQVGPSGIVQITTIGGEDEALQVPVGSYSLRCEIGVITDENHPRYSPIDVHCGQWGRLSFFAQSHPESKVLRGDKFMKPSYPLLMEAKPVE